ncbi:hypothetical protein CRUP_008426 [Coryphaenoides rupestris]|nr:hypothetical protein CRUP_008426 [Coryphaenoides rupestris]
MHFLCVYAVVQLNPALVSLGGPPLTQQGQDALKGQISDLWRPSNPVRTIIGERVQGFLRATLEASAARRTPPEPPAPAMPLPDHPGEPAAPDHAPPGLPPLEEPPSPTGSPPRTLSMSSLVEVENCMANLSLAHEIVVNENFRFRSSSSSPPRESDLKEALQALGDQAVVQLNPALVSLGGPPLTQQGQDTLKGQISDLWRPSNPVRTIIGERVQGFLRATLEASAARRTPPEPPALGAAFSKTVNFNRSVFGPRYAPVLRRLLFPFPPTEGPESGEVAR